MNKETIIEIICSLLVVLFLYTGLTKLYGHESFERVLIRSPLLSSIGGVIAWSLPLSEIAIAILLAFKQTRLKGLFLSALLLFGLTVYLVYMVVNYPKLPCHCGGVISKLTWRQHIPFNICFLIIALMGIKLTKATNKTHSSL